MGDWCEITSELKEALAAKSPTACDDIRRKHLLSMHKHTGRGVILYASKWTQPHPGVPLELISITEEDVQGLMTAIHGLGCSKLDLILHSPGGSADAAEALMIYLTSHFEHIRVFVPYAAMSAASMIACAADEIVMGEHSFLGPIDPQLILDTPLGQRMVPAQAILQQFKQARDECTKPEHLATWAPMLVQYGPDLLAVCRNASQLSVGVVRRCLAQRMFAGLANPKRKAYAVAKWLCAHRTFKSHSRHLHRSLLLDKGLNITALEEDEVLQDLCLSVFHATTRTFDHTPAVKIVESHLGKAFIKQCQIIPVTAGPVGVPKAAPADDS